MGSLGTECASDSELTLHRLLFHRLRVQFLKGFASGQALGDDEAPGFDAQFG